MPSAKVLVFAEPGKPEIRTLDTPSLHDDEVLVQTHYTGVSVGTESSIFMGTRTQNGGFPFVPGYQFTGDVMEVGSGVEHVKPGDKVVGGPPGRWDGVESIWGTHASHLAVPATAVSKVVNPERMRELSQFVMPSVAANLLNHSGAKAGDVVAVTGQGLIGQFVAQLARLRGCLTIASEMAPDRLAFSRTYCADVVVDAGSEDIVDVVMKHTDGVGADIAIEASGYPGLIDTAFATLKTDGTFVFGGWYPDKVSFYYHDVHAKCARIHTPSGSGSPAVAAAMQRMIQRGDLVVEPLITHELPAEQILDGYRMIIDGRKGEINGMVIRWI